LLGTRYYASVETLGHDEAKQRIVHAQGDQTKRTSVFDIIHGYDWPQGFTGRALRNQFLEQWHGSEEALTGIAEAERAAFWAAASAGHYEMAMVWAGEAVDMIPTIESAGV